MTDAVTKTCNLTEDEVWAVMQYHGRQIANSGPYYGAAIERLNYLNKRVAAFKEPEEKVTATSVPKTEVAPAASGWGAAPNG